MTSEASLEEDIRLQELDTLTALNWAKEGKIEAWVHKYLLSGSGGSSNPAFSDGLKRGKRWWIGPIYLNLTDLSQPLEPTQDWNTQLISNIGRRVRAGWQNRFPIQSRCRH